MTDGFTPYSPDEIWTLILNVDCIQDCQEIAGWLNENRMHFDGITFACFTKALMIYIDILI